jgi:RNA recognition motif-containing protein
VEATIVTRGRRALGYGFITYATEAEATQAATELDKKVLDGRVIYLEVARPKKAVEAKKVPIEVTEEAKKAPVTITEEVGKAPVAVTEEEHAVIDKEQKVKKAPTARKAKKPKAAKKKKTRATEPSKTTLFVANLPYVTTDADLKTLFGAYPLVSAQVSRMKNGCSKGYGFVEFETEQDQIKAFEALKDIQLEGRAVYLKIALSEQRKEETLEEKVESLDI